jgi:hypothetical protein
MSTKFTISRIRNQEYKYKNTKYKGGGVNFRIEQESYTLRCPCLQVKGTNNKIRTMKRQAYGYRDMEFFKLKILGLHETRYALVG